LILRGKVATSISFLSDQKRPLRLIAFTQNGLLKIDTKAIFDAMSTMTYRCCQESMFSDWRFSFN